MVEIKSDMSFELNNSNQPAAFFQKIQAGSVTASKGQFEVLNAGKVNARTLVSNVNTIIIDHENFVEDIEVTRWWEAVEIDAQIYSTASVNISDEAGTDLLIDTQTEGIGADFWVNTWDHQIDVYTHKIDPFLNVNMPSGGTEGQKKVIVIRRHSSNDWWNDNTGVRVRLNLGDGTDSWFESGDGGFGVADGDLVISTLFCGGKWVVVSSSVGSSNPSNIWTPISV